MDRVARGDVSVLIKVRWLVCDRLKLIYLVMQDMAKSVACARCGPGKEQEDQFLQSVYRARRQITLHVTLLSSWINSIPCEVQYRLARKSETCMRWHVGWPVVTACGCTRILY